MCEFLSTRTARRASPGLPGGARRPKAAPAADDYVYSLMPVLEGKWPTLVYPHDIDY
jgi:hypothetical protein